MLERGAVEPLDFKWRCVIREGNTLFMKFHDYNELFTMICGNIKDVSEKSLIRDYTTFYEETILSVW
ncbi:MAG: hypothetical protein DRJ43_05140 [Thermoprotei archaeon]|nr:MAG: hypothetical protein DRJ43_05140 [Thermoprotei archaeon]